MKPVKRSSQSFASLPLVALHVAFIAILSISMVMSLPTLN